MTSFSFKSIKSLKPISLNAISLPFKLQRRERMAVTAAAAALALFLVLQFIVFPIVGKRDRLKAEIKNKTVALSEIRKLKAEYEALTQSARGTENQLKQRNRGFTLFSFLDTLAGKSGIKQNIEYMKPSTANLKNSAYALSIVELKMQALSMEQLVNYLHGVENSDQQVWISRMSISKDEKNPGLIGAVMQVETYQL